MKILAKIIKFILMTILVICIVAIGMIKIVSSTVLEKAYITQKLEETNFYLETYELVKSNFENYIYQSGLDEVVLDDICSEEKVKSDINQIISNIYEGTDIKIDTKEISDNLNANIDKLNIKNSRNEKAIEQFVKHITDEYTNTILHTKYEDDINNAYGKITNLIEKANTIIIIAIIVDIIIIILTNIKKISRNLQDAGITLLASSSFVLIANNIVQSKVNISGIKIFNDSFSEVIVKILQEFVEKINTFGMITLIVAIILIIIYIITILLQKTKEESTSK